MNGEEIFFMVIYILVGLVLGLLILSVNYYAVPKWIIKMIRRVFK